MTAEIELFASAWLAAVEIAECSDEVAFRTSGKHATPAAQNGFDRFSAGHS
jgi:hypothetical protein